MSKNLRDIQSADRADLTPEERRDLIRDLVLSEDVVVARDLATRFDVSVMTIHRDLDELESRGILRKTRGGATAQPSSLFESSVQYRIGSAKAEKEAISRHAFQLLESGQAVMLSDATTLVPMVKLLPSLAPLTVITNYLASIEALRGAPGIRLIALGGEYHPTHESFVGIVCQSAIAALRADICFISVPAVAGGIAYHQEQEIVLILRAMMRSSTRKVLLVDHTKIGKVALHEVAPLTDFDLVIVDEGISATGLQELRDARVNLAVASADHTEDEVR